MNKLTSIAAAMTLGASLLSAPVQAETPSSSPSAPAGHRVYYAAGGAICRLMNKDRATHGIRCSVDRRAARSITSTPSRGGELDFGVAQSDAQYNAVKGIGQLRMPGDGRAARGVLDPFPSRSWCWPGKPASPRSRTSRASASTSAILARHPRHHGRADGRAGLKMSGLLAGLRAQGRRARRGAVRQQDRRFRLRGRQPSANIRDPTTTCGVW